MNKFNELSIDLTKQAILYDIVLPGETKSQVERRLSESESLLKTFGGITISKVMQRRHHAGSKSFIGKGKLVEIVDSIVLCDANLLIINAALKPKQLYAIEAYLEEVDHKIEVWDRVDLILKIFQKHAQTAEAKLQVELAKLTHLGPRVYNMSEELGQQSGTTGGGSNRGQGETNTEVMKRHIAEQKAALEQKLEHLSSSRSLIRARRSKNGMKTISIVGYTNAGKSELFRTLTGKDVYVKDELFATLDTVTSKLYLPKPGKELLIADTIGFIQNLPPKLVEAFKSTLEETIYADFLIHVVDISDEHAVNSIKVVNQIIGELGCSDIPRLTIFNKIDLIPNFDEKNFEMFQFMNPIYISAKNKLNIDEVLSYLSDYFFRDVVCDGWHYSRLPGSVL